jgi:cytochrome c biogenesis protein CcmG/thiol:disulfide interchange protein DsbE
MAQNDDIDHWVKVRLATLAPAENWQPDVSAALASARASQSADSSRRRRWVGAVIAVTIIGSSLPGVRVFGSRCLDACVNVTARATQLWHGAEPAASLPKAVGGAIGDLAPDVLGTDIQGSLIRVSSMHGHIVLVNFWATWCPPCKKEIPLLNDLQTRFGPLGFNVVGVSLDEDGWNAVSPFTAQQPIGYTVGLRLDDTLAALGGVNTVPQTFILDREGRVVIKHLGLVADTIEAEIATLLGR